MAHKWVTVRRADDDETLVERARWCDSFVCRLRGLTFRRHLSPKDAIVLVERTASITGASIHMFFVFFPIAAIWVDESGKVVDAQLAKPFRPLYVPKAAALYILEGPPSLLDTVQAGDRVRFEFSPR